MSNPQAQQASTNGGGFSPSALWNKMKAKGQEFYDGAKRTMDTVAEKTGLIKDTAHGAAHEMVKSVTQGTGGLIPNLATGVSNAATHI